MQNPNPIPRSSCTMQTRPRRRKITHPHDDPAETQPLKDQQSVHDPLPPPLEPTTQTIPTSSVRRRSVECRNQARPKHARTMIILMSRVPVSFHRGKNSRTKYLYRYSDTPHILSTMTIPSNLSLRADGLSTLRISAVSSPNQLSKSYTRRLHSSR